MSQGREKIGDKCDDMKCDIVKNNLQVGRDGSTEM